MTDCTLCGRPLDRKGPRDCPLCSLRDDRSRIVYFLRQRALAARLQAATYKGKGEGRVWQKIDEALGQAANCIERGEHMP